MEGIPLLVLGLVLLVAGADVLVRGAVSLALRLRLSPAIVGLTVVAIGTSLPEFVICLASAIQGDTELVAGTVIGSNLFNLGAVLGLSALICPMIIRGTLKHELPAMVGVTLLVVAFGWDGSVERFEGIVLIVVAIGFVTYLLKKTAVARQKGGVCETGISPPMSTPKTLAAIVVGCACLHFGGNLTVDGAVFLAKQWGWPQRLIALTLISFGTSAPELAVCVVAAFRGRTELAIGNIVGSCIFNLSVVLGSAGAVRALVIPSRTLELDFYWLSGLSIAVLITTWTRKRLDRWEGGLLLGIFGVYYILLLS